MPTVSIGLDTFSTVNSPGTAKTATTSTVYGYGYGTTPGQIGISFSPATAQGVTLAYGVPQTVTLGAVTQNEAINGGASAPTAVAGQPGVPQLYGPTATDEPTTFGGTDGHSYYHLASNQPVYTGPSNSPLANQGGFYAPAEGTGGVGLVQPDNTIHADTNYLDVGLGFTVTDGTASASLSFLAALGRLTATPPTGAVPGGVTLYHGYVADPDVDYRLDLGTRTASFANGDTLKITFNTLTLANNPDTAALTATLTLSGPPPTYAIAATDAVKAEGNTGTTPFTFTVSRSGDTGAAASLTYAVTGTGTSPAPASEFAGGVLPSGTINFAAGASSATITVPVVGNTVVQPDLGFTVTLSGPAGTTITTATASGTIQNDDLSVASASYAIAAVSADKPDGTRGTTPYTFTVTRTGDTSQTATLSYTVAGTGSSPAPAYIFANPAGTVAFAAGATSATVTVNVNAAAVRVAETFAVTLTAPTGATLTQATATGTIGANTSTAPRPSDIALSGTHDQYVIAATLDGRAAVQDLMPGRDGTQVVAGLQRILFADGTGEFDATGTLESVTRLYQAAFNRTPDLPGLEHNRDLVDGGQISLKDLAQSFTQSPEFIGLYNALDNTGFVQQLYQNVLHRAGEPAGVQNWLNQINGAGFTRGQVLTGLADSRENRKQVLSIAGDKNDGQASRLYQAALNRTPDDAGLTYWSGRLQSGQNLDTVAAGFTGSQEFKQLYGALTPENFVTQLYGNVLHRTADAAGLGYWVGQIGSGVSREHVLVGFSEANENRINTGSITHDAWVFLK